MTDENQASDGEVVESTITLDEDTPMSGEVQETGDTGDNQESNEEKAPLFDEAQQQVFNNKMAEEKRQRRQLETDKQALATQLQELQSRQPENQRPVVPDFPSQYDFDTDEEFHTALKDRDAKFKEALVFDTRADLQVREGQMQQQEQQRIKKESIDAADKIFRENGVKNGISNEEMGTIIDAVNQHGIDPSVGNYVMGRPDGALIAKFLADNPLELDNIYATGSIANAAIYIETKVAPKAAVLKPQTSNAPDPLDTLQGSGQPKQARGPKGATYE